MGENEYVGEKGYESGEVKVSPEFLKGVLELIAKYPAAWAVINDLAHYDGRLYQKQLSISDKWARKIEKAMLKAGVINISPTLNEEGRGFRKYLELTEDGKKLIETLGLDEYKPKQ